ncbi:hypothetical protein [Novosphingobium sp. PhB165]|uniref:hypothetical protein n=1 Tax=Novosphingobium sp. PhB165 TaxID=2485105 RepID=UPI0014055EE8|nr:hypothetical protein [Novosphingobium sp. PhB165]
MALLAFTATSASAYDGTSISVSGRVPTVCQVSIAGSSARPIQAGTNDLGVMNELCNNLAGYTVTLNHPAGLVNSWVEVGSQRIAISPNDTQTVIVDNRAPAYRTEPLRLVLSQAPESATNFSLNAEAKGTIF